MDLTVEDILKIISHPIVPNAQVTSNGSNSSTLWETKSAGAILLDLTQTVNEIKTLTKGIESPNFLALSPSRFELLRNTRISEKADTILNAFNNWFPEIHVESVKELAGAFQNGTEGFLLGCSEKFNDDNDYPIKLTVPDTNHIYRAEWHWLTLPKRGPIDLPAYPLAFSKKYGI